MLPNGREYASFSVDNSLYGAKYIVKASIKALKAKRLKEIHFGLKATSIYGKNLIYYLNDDEFKRYYRLKYNEVNKGNHKRALALTARKFVRVVFHLLKNNQIYIPRK